MTAHTEGELVRIALDLVSKGYGVHQAVSYVMREVRDHARRVYLWPRLIKKVEAKKRVRLVQTRHTTPQKKVSEERVAPSAYAHELYHSKRSMD